ncbi:MAG: 50S ribosomal protein L25 [Sedimentisphaerales bacterium]|nr:50S ribosomal protein L25 [Sedimentisphaerales bacterium]
MTEEAIVLKAERKQQAGTRVSRKLRLAGRVPAIIYGHQQEPESVHLDYHDLALELQHHHRLLAVELAGQRQQVLVKEVQYDHLGDKIIHVDLARVRLDERVEVTVALELKGTPAGAAEGGVLEQLLGEIELECLVTSIPESIRVPVAAMQVGDLLTAGQLVLPEGAKLITDPETPVVSVSVMAAEEVAEEAVEGEAEPEVIARKAEEDESAKTED